MVVRREGQTPPPFHSEDLASDENLGRHPRASIRILDRQPSLMAAFGKNSPDELYALSALGAVSAPQPIRRNAREEAHPSRRRWSDDEKARAIEASLAPHVFAFPSSA
jgi:hypothetical protein